jgi:hypothetical protein
MAGEGAIQHSGQAFMTKADQNKIATGKSRSASATTIENGCSCI